ncbi:MAG: YfhO family protein [Marinilabiliaceae bacterium]|nr:YfhO family protein [Marinilabiliaceae bacterium]
MKKKLPYIIAIAAAIIISYVYFSPLLENKKLYEHDRLASRGALEESSKYYSNTGEVTHWSNSMFGGMPNITFWAKLSGNVAKDIRRLEKMIFAYPASFLIILILGSFFCLLLFGVNPWLSLVGALLYSFGSHFFILVGAGHMAKLWALAYMTPLIGAIYYTFHKNKLMGAVITALFLSLEIASEHPQINYYIFICILIFGIVELFFAIKQKNGKNIIISVLYLLLPMLIGVGTNANYMIATKEYSQYSTRGQNELTVSDNQGKTGLSKDYILGYSYDFSESLTAFIPRLKGGGMSEPLGENSELYGLIEKFQGKAEAKKFVKNVPLYWGSQPIVSGPFYFGAITIFLFVLGLFVVKGNVKWWLVGVVIISFLLSLGKYLPSISNFAIDYFPLYNKFRDVKNIVFIQSFAMWLLGILALKEMFQDKKLEIKQHIKGLKYASIITGGIALILAMIPTIIGSFTGEVDTQLASSGWPQQLLDALRNDRISVARADSFRSLIFVLLTAGVIWGVLKNKLKISYAIVIGILLVLIDLWPVNKRYLNNDNFVANRKAEVPFTPSLADKEILKDKSIDYRVLNIAVNPWNDASTSYFHKSIGGYSGAKINRYQDMIEHHLSPEIQQLSSRLRTVKTQAGIDSVFIGLNSINMLNTKYIIYNPGNPPLTNIHALGNAWFVNSYIIVPDANAEIAQVGKVDVERTAIVDKRFEKMLPSSIIADSSATIKLQSYAPNKLIYKTNSLTDQLAVFSEIYYPKGWTVKIDGEQADHFRVNYILRAMMVPSGNHEITFEFDPISYKIGNTISYVSSILLLLAIAGVVVVELIKRKQGKKNKELLTENK